MHIHPYVSSGGTPGPYKVESKATLTSLLDPSDMAKSSTPRIHVVHGLAEPDTQMSRTARQHRVSPVAKSALQNFGP